MSLDFGLNDVHVLITYVTPPNTNHKNHQLITHISGAAGGIGLETAKVFLQLGARVTAHYNSKLGDLAHLSGKITAVQADVRNEDAVQKLFVQAAEKNSGQAVSVLVVNHGVWPEKDAHVADMDLKQWKNTIDVDLTGPFLLCREFLRALRGAGEEVKEKANIIFVGSTAGKFGEAAHGDYAASKSALMYGLTPTLKNEIVHVAPKGRVNSVNPGWVATPLVEEVLNDEKFVERALATTPLQKVGRPRDVANQIAVMASQTLSGHLSGVNLQVDGGMEGRLLYPPRLQ
ncbi:uncharacterized protein MYCFIDRAFT_125752 [Pseudocercospora fijiensis CIRAD86]|uniref:Uncharacterized protein n=1 Tax=Pseudocercospora fijiensis (strain CIRAD86) TaxID=383855 RepID=N1QCZ7_PSEFD|nr:uncharacterized protein MYCFIDRAFT_125752 [Pseudocercospora fijiensis CIRAD86]EME89503.1 hypothetical protein MYCFIDRAFT_125752 [Pseudocercospora fijiensis CIRAD86]